MGFENSFVKKPKKIKRKEKIMFKKLGIAVCTALLVLTASMVTPATAEEEKVLNIYFWFEYLPDSIVKDFEKETGIKVVLDTFESLDIMETKLLAGKSGYDIVIPDYIMAGRLMKLDIFKKLDKSRFSNWGNLDPAILASLAKFDKGNNYGVPYMWGTTGIAFNDAMVKKRLPNADLRSWDLLFKPENISKLSDCGVAFLDAWAEIIPIALNYLGLDPHSVKKADLEKAEKLLMSIRPYIRHFNSGAIIEELATGELCAVITYNGDGGLASARADELKNGVFVDYSIPKESTITWIDFLSIPADAPHPDNAHKFFDFLMRPKQIAKVTNTFWYANGNAAALAYVEDEIKGDPDIYPPPEVMDKLFQIVDLSNKDRRKYTRLWTKIKANK
jgi:putrescine transport system substrate-binding protein